MHKTLTQLCTITDLIATYGLLSNTSECKQLGDKVKPIVESIKEDLISIALDSNQIRGGKPESLESFKSYGSTIPAGAALIGAMDYCDALSDNFNPYTAMNLAESLARLRSQVYVVLLEKVNKLYPFSIKRKDTTKQTRYRYTTPEGDFTYFIANSHVDKCFRNSGASYFASLYSELDFKLTLAESMWLQISTMYKLQKTTGLCFAPPTVESAMPIETLGSKGTIRGYLRFIPVDAYYRIHFVPSSMSMRIHSPEARLQHLWGIWVSFTHEELNKLELT